MTLLEIAYDGILADLLGVLLKKGEPVFAEVEISNLSGKDEKHKVKVMRVNKTDAEHVQAFFTDPVTDREHSFELLSSDDEDLELVKQKTGYLLRYKDRKKRITV